MNKQPFYQEQHNSIADLFSGLATLFNTQTRPRLQQMGVKISKDFYCSQVRPETTKAYRAWRKRHNRISADSRRRNRAGHGRI
jgi:hypothetical protein